MSYIDVSHLVKHFPVRGGVLNRVVNSVQAVTVVSLQIEKGQTLGVIDESGCGKSTLGKTMIRLIEPTSGSVCFDGREITGLSHRELMPIRRQMQFIFQYPFSSLNPRMTAGQMLREVIRFHNVVPRNRTHMNPISKSPAGRCPRQKPRCRRHLWADPTGRRD